MTQLLLPLTFAPWSGYGWILYRGRRLYALVYHTWDRWFAEPRWNPGLKRLRCGTVDQIQFAERVEPLSVRGA